MDGQVLPASDWWSGDQMATRAVEENVKKDRRSFFLYGGIGVVQGDLSPLSSRSVVEVCVMPIVLYGCESWILSEEILRRLESFQGEMGKTILEVAKCTSNTAVGVVMGWPSMRARVLVRKLSFLRRLVLGDGSKLGSRMLRSLVDDEDSVTLVRECRELEEAYGTHYTDAVLRAEEEVGPHPREMKEEILRLDREMRLIRCTQADKAPVVADIARLAGWERLWDAALDEGPRCIKRMK